VSDEYVFKVPSLRNVALTPPYFHTGKSWDL
jgi:cytochrome c peroxidase